MLIVTYWAKQAQQAQQAHDALEDLFWEMPDFELSWYQQSPLIL